MQAPAGRQEAAGLALTPWLGPGRGTALCFAGPGSHGYTSSQAASRAADDHS